jgi:hypothetical protein
MSLLVAGLLLGVDGAFYLALAASMLLPPGGPRWREQLARLYPSVFQPPSAAACHEDEEDSQNPMPVAAMEPSGLSYRLLGYLLAILGLCRLVTCFHWGCGYMYLGLATCLGEIAMLCHELLRHDSLQIHRAMAVLMQNVAVSLLYIGAGVPYCSS